MFVFPPEGGQNVRNGLCLRTFRYRSALMMMTWIYDREQTRLEDLKIECRRRGLCHRIHLCRCRQLTDLS